MAEPFKCWQIQFLTGLALRMDEEICSFLCS